MKLVLGLLALAGCDKLFGITPFDKHPIDSGAPLDTRPVDSGGEGPWVCDAPPNFNGWLASPIGIDPAIDKATHPTVDLAHQTIFFAAEGTLYRAAYDPMSHMASGAIVLTPPDTALVESAPSLSPDEAHLYFSSERGPEMANQSSPNTWTAGEMLDVPATLMNVEVGSPTFGTEHGVRMVVSAGTPGQLHELVQQGAKWLEVPGTVSELNLAGAPSIDPFLASNGCYLLFSSARGGGPDLNLYLSVRQDNGTFATPLPILASALDERGPSVAGDNLFFQQGTKLVAAQP